MIIAMEILLVIVCVAVVVGVSVTAIKRKKKGKCAFDCGGDCAHCSYCNNSQKDLKKDKK